MGRKRVLMTRPASQGDSLCRLLEAAGFDVRHVPVLAISPLNTPEAVRNKKHCFAHTGGYAGLIIVSLNAAEQALPELEDYLGSISGTQTIFTVGKTTAGFLQQTLNAESKVHILHPQQMDSEGLLALAELQQQQVAGKEFLLLRGEGGRTLIAETLIDRGAHVHSCALYRRHCPEENADALQTAVQDSDIILINSVESLENFITLAGISLNHAQNNAVCIVPGKRVSTAAQQAGFQHIMSAENATDSAVMASVQQACTTD